MPIEQPANGDTSWGDEVRAAIAAVNSLEGVTAANLPETIRDTIGSTVVGSGLVTVTPSDVADTVTVATTATANSSDAFLRDRTNHNGTQTAVTISDLSEAVDDRVAALLTAGANISLTYNDVAGTLTIAASGAGGGLTLEEVQDAVGAMVVGTGLITTTYNDTLGTHTVSTTATAWDAEQTRDTIATALVAGTNVTITPNDGADTITIAAAGASGITPTIVDAKGDLIVATAADTVARLAVGTNGSIPIAASGQTTGLAWTPYAQVHAVGNSGTALTLDASSTSGYIKTVTLTGNCTFTFTGATSGQAARLELVLTQDGTGSRTVTWPGSVQWASGVAPVLKTAAGAVDRFVLTSYNGGTTWFGTPATVEPATEVGLFRPENYGAVGNGTTNDTTALQAMFTAAAAFGSSARVLITKTHRVAGTGILSVTKGCEIYGGGTLTVAPSNGPYEAILNCNFNEVSNLYIHDLKLNGNQTNNVLVAGDLSGLNLPSGENRQGIMFNHGNYIRVEDCRFTDFDGTWVISCTGAKDVRIHDCLFEEIGQTTTATTRHDHSSIYLDCAAMEISHNTFNATGSGETTSTLNYGAVSAIESHGSFNHVHDNTIIGYLVGGQLSSSSVFPPTSVDWHDNQFYGVGNGIHMVPYPTTYGLTNVNVHDNIFEIDYLTWRLHPFVSGGVGIGMINDTTAPITNLRLQRNQITFRQGTYTGTTSVPGNISPAIGFWQLDAGNTGISRDIHITDNIITGAPNNGIYFYVDQIDGLDISRNTIRNCNTTAMNEGSPYEWGIFVATDNYARNARVDDNYVIDDQTSGNSIYGNTGSTLKKGYYLFAGTGSARCRARNNQMHVEDAAVIPFLENAARFTIDPPILAVDAYYSPARDTVTTAAHGAAVASYSPITLGSGIITRIGCEVTTSAASSTVRLGIYHDSGAGRPGQLWFDAGTVDSTTTGTKTITISKQSHAGLYWLVAVAQGGSPTLRALAGSGEFRFGAPSVGAVSGNSLTGMSASGVTGALATTAPDMAANINAYMVYVKSTA
jgi:hypothetical protein